LSGDALDFWRVERYEPDRALRLRAEMRLPGRAWLEYDAVPTDDGQRTVVRQTATFDPAGLGGRLYWYGIYPIHRVMFAGLLRRIARMGRQDPDREIAPPQSLGAVVLWVTLCLAVGALGGLFTAESVSDWYPTLRKPAWTPPGWIFGPVWTLLYVMMGVAAARVWVWRRRRPVGVALSLFGVQLGLNLLWSALFFGLREPGWALVEIGALLVAIGATGIAFWRVERAAAMLLVPYLGWVGFASALNLMLWKMNG